MKKTDVLLTYGWVRSTYAALRNLYKHGLTVAISDSYRFGMCQYSRYARSFSLYSNPFSFGEEKFLHDLLGIIDEYSPRVLLPSHDETAIIAKYRYAFPKELLIPITDYHALVMANDKQKMHDFANACGISVPCDICYNCVSDLFTMLSDNDIYVVKLRQGNSAKGVFYTKGRNQTVDQVQRLVLDYHLESDRYPIVQEYVQGEGWGVSCLYWHGDRIASFTHQRLREKISTGGTSTLRAGRSNPSIENAAHKLLDSMLWHGLIMVEFKYDSKSGKYWFIETNPRMWGSIHLAVASGVEFPFLAYLCATEGPAAAKAYAQSERKVEMIARWYLGDLLALLSDFKEKKHLISALSLILPGGADTYDDFFVDDPLVIGGEFLNYAYRFIKTRSINPAEEGTLG